MLGCGELLAVQNILILQLRLRIRRKRKPSPTSVRHFLGADRFGIAVMIPREFLGENRNRGQMSRSIAVPDDLYKKAVELAAKDRVSVEEFVSTVLANRVASREFIESRARLFDSEAFEQALTMIPDVEPEDHDRL